MGLVSQLTRLRGEKGAPGIRNSMGKAPEAGGREAAWHEEGHEGEEVSQSQPGRLW